MEASNSGHCFSRSSTMDSTHIPSPPSPASSPSLTQSASNSSSSPPQPTTPPRQSRPRYPDLGRVPLHRRGTSKTYEHLEDLLREAGYKETRIFTPESDKHGIPGDRDEENHSGSKKLGVGAAVVGFLTGLVTGGNTTDTGTGASMGGAAPDLRQDRVRGLDDNNLAQCQRPFRAQPPSPLVDKHPQRRNGSRSDESSVPQTPLMTSSIESLNESTPKVYRRQNSSSYSIQNQSQPPTRPTTPSYYSHTSNPYRAPPPASTSTISSNHQPLQHRLSAAQRQLQHQVSRSSINTQTGCNNNKITSVAAATTSHITNPDLGNGVGNVIHNPRPSRAGDYLRHMVSTPTVPPPRPSSTPVHRRASRKDDSDVEVVPSQQHPPLPRNWLDNVARAILFGAAVTPNIVSDDKPLNNDASITSPHLLPPYQRPLRATRSSLSQTTIVRASKASAAARRSGLSDQTNTIPPSLQVLTPPALFTRLERGRAPCSQSVLKAQVVCRSAPGSRASSLVRQTSNSNSAFLRDRKSGNEVKTSLVVDGGGGRQTRKRQQSGGESKAVGGTSGGDVNGSKRGRINTRRKKKQKDEVTRVPSLARTRIEGDAWTDPALPRVLGFSKAGGGTTILRTGPSSDNDDLSDYTDDEEDEEEEDGELDLAKMLVPPKRQHSIRSLRKHLHGQLTSPSLTDVTSTTTQLHPSLSRLNRSSSGSTYRPNNGRVVSAGTQPRLGGMQEEGGGTNEWEHEWRRGEFNSRRSSEDDEVETMAWLSRNRGKGSQRSTVKARLSLPGLWNVNENIQEHQ